MMHARELLARHERALGEAQQEIGRLKLQVQRLAQALEGKPSADEKFLPAFVKPNLEKKGRKAPGRPIGHAPAHRVLPGRIDLHI